MQKRIDDKCKCKSSTGSTHVECCNICGLPLPKETWHFILSDHDISRVGAVVMPNEVVAGGRKRWKPKEKEIFYYVNFYTGVTEQIYTNSKIHTPRNLYKIGNCYKTKEEARIKWEQIKQILLQR